MSPLLPILGMGMTPGSYKDPVDEGRLGVVSEMCLHYRKPPTVTTADPNVPHTRALCSCVPAPALTAIPCDAPVAVCVCRCVSTRVRSGFPGASS